MSPVICLTAAEGCYVCWSQHADHLSEYTLGSSRTEAVRPSDLAFQAASPLLKLAAMTAFTQTFQ